MKPYTEISVLFLEDGKRKSIETQETHIRKHTKTETAEHTGENTRANTHKGREEGTLTRTQTHKRDKHTHTQERATSR